MRPAVARENLELRQLVLRAAVYPLLLRVVVALVLALVVVTLRSSAERVDHSDQVLARVDRITLLAVEQEDALRGYLLTGRAELLEGYRAAERDLGPALDDLQRLLSDNPGQLARAARMRQLAEVWRQVGAEALPPGGGVEGGAAGVLARKPILDALRSEAERCRSAEEQLRSERYARATRVADMAVVSAVALSILLGFALALLARAQVRRVAALYQRTVQRADLRADQLAESEERFRLFVEGVHDAAIYMIDPEGKVRSWNLGAERIKGYRPEEVIGQHFSLFYTPEDVTDGLPERDLAEAAGSGQLENESWRVRKDGSRFWAAITMRALRGADGRIVGYAKLVRDTTDRKRAEMRRSAQYAVARVLSEGASLDVALPSVLAGIGAALGYAVGLAWSPDGDRLRVAATWHRRSASTEGFLAVTRALWLERGEGLAGGVWSSGRPAWVEDVRSDLSRPQAPLAMEAGLFSALAFPVVAGGKVALVVELLAGDRRDRDPELLQAAATVGAQIGTYLERQRAAEEAQEAAARRAEELERRVEERTVELTAVNRELEAFSYSVSHDLRAPLRAMDGFSQVLLEDYGSSLDAQGREYLGRIRAASQRMSRLIDDLIQLSRVTRSELRREPVDLSALVREVAAEVQEREPGRRVELEVQDGVAVRGDARLLRVGLVNLIGNAFKFTRDHPAPRIRFEAVATPRERVYTLRDNGAGFDMAYAAKLFKPFQRLHTAAEFEGTGIGLATWQRIVHRHGGRVWAEAAPGRGAAFHFTLGEH